MDDKYIMKGSGTKSDPYRVSWDMLVSTEQTYQPRLGRKIIPGRVKMLDGKWVRISGYIAFPVMAESADEMLMMLNQWDGCCIGVPPTPYDAIEVKLKEAAKGDTRLKTTGTRTGILRVDPYLVKDWRVSLFVMDSAEELGDCRGQEPEPGQARRRITPPPPPLSFPHRGSRAGLPGQGVLELMASGQISPNASPLSSFPLIRSIAHRSAPPDSLIGARTPNSCTSRPPMCPALASTISPARSAISQTAWVAIQIGRLSRSFRIVERIVIAAYTAENPKSSCGPTPGTWAGGWCMSLGCGRGSGGADR